MDRPAQETLPVAAGIPRRRRCRRCHQPLTDPVSRMRGLGKDCDPDRRTADPQHDVDQDTIPGT
ncbi:DUF6011 domain-containing protein [Streptomyces sp. 8L]|uniref:DUF6011 domain-containing protein n=1 Tax=Streptomyces sp. 8L TaxID=2877242 RepID=UPI001CD3401D|nr:DUF6011 domain-containing protein [Streptomyces sp. 8L]MCA1224250.1 DUF6011 domain-containing protein [Streptomyces sp. 8L]